MTTPDPRDDDPTLSAMQTVGQALARGLTYERAFLEERSDLRLVIGSEGRHDLRVTRSRGAAIDGSDSIHLTDPPLEELVALADRKPAGATGLLERPRTGRSTGAGWEFDRDWIASRELAIRPPLERGVGGIPGGRWSATLVAFHQSVWVASGDGHVTRDVRRGSRLELRAWIDGYPKTMVATDRVHENGAPALPDGLTDKIGDRVLEKRRCIEAMNLGTTCAVFAPGVGGVVIHELVGHALEGDVALERQTWIQGIGTRPCRELTVIDDPRRGRGAWTIDDEGTPSQATVLVADGFAADLLLDRAAAIAMGRSSTGHGRRSSYLTAPRPRMGCTWLGPGPDEPSDVLRDTNAGVFIRRMTSGHTDPFSGRASFLVTEADRIVAGRLERPLEPFVMHLDGIEVWGSIDRVCSDVEFDTCVGSCVRDGQPLAVSVGAPTIRVGVIRVVT